MYKHALSIEIHKEKEIEYRAKRNALLSAKEHADPDLACLLYTSPSPRDRQKSRMPSSA